MGAMKATDVIRRDHETVKQMFAAFEDATDSEQDQMESDIFDALTSHERMEDKIFYPAVRKAMDAKGRDTGELTSIELDQKKLEAEVLGARALPGDKSERIAKIKDTILAHASREENEILTQAESIMSEEELERLGDLMEPESATTKSGK